MDPIDYWKLCDEYSVVQAALLMAGYDPDEYQNEIESNNRGTWPPGYGAVRTALCNAIYSGSISTEKLVRYDNGYGDISKINPQETLIRVDVLDGFCRSKGMLCDFFARGTSVSVAPASPHSEFYSPKLDAANKAWSAVTSDPARIAGKSPKEALRGWLTEHAGELGLLNKHGKPNTTGIEEICKVANWKPGGGATPTPAPKVLAQPPVLQRLPAPASRAPTGPRETFSEDLDDEIPF